MPTATHKNQRAPRHSASRDEAAIRAVITGVFRAHYDKDAAAIVAPYAPDAEIFDLSPPLSHSGMNLREKQSWLASWDGPIECGSRDLEVTISGDSAFCHGFFWLSGTPQAAGRPISFWMRATVCLRRGQDGWHIVHEHTSVPFYMDGSLRPAFDLEP